MANEIDFNCDMGESFGMYKMGHDEEVIKYITSANIACGFHAGDPQWMNHTVKLALEHDVAVGAHPSFPDLNGFGRRNMNATSAEDGDGNFRNTSSQIAINCRLDLLQIISESTLTL